MRLETRREAFLQVPKWRWPKRGPDTGRSVISGYHKPPGRWVRPILPKHQTPKSPPLKVAKDDSRVWLMRPQDVKRAQIVLALYLQAMGLKRYEEFQEHRWTFDYMGYPGPPVRYAGKDIDRMVCCPGKFDLHRSVAEDRSLRNPVSYTFCLAHWRAMLKDAWENHKGRLEVPGVDENESARVAQIVRSMERDSGERGRRVEKPKGVLDHVDPESGLFQRVYRAENWKGGKG